MFEESIVLAKKTTRRNYNETANITRRTYLSSDPCRADRRKRKKTTKQTRVKQENESQRTRKL